MLKRPISDTSDQLKNAVPKKSWDHTSANDKEITLSDNVTYSSVPEQRLSPEPILSEDQLTTSTTVQSFSTYTYSTAEFYGPNQMTNQMMMQNPMMMYNPVRNYPCYDNSMYPMPVMDTMPMNSTNVPYSRNMEPVVNNTTNSSNFEPQPAESNTTEIVRKPSPPLPVPYSDAEAASLIEKLRNEDTFKASLQTLCSWLKKSEFNKSNCTYLFSLVQCAQNNVWRLMNEKASHKEDLNEVKLVVSRKMNEIISQFQEIWKVCETAKKQKVWDQFTKPQRKNISTWITETQRIMEGLMRELAAENMDPDENSSEKSPDSSDSQQEARVEEHQKYSEELEDVNTQIRAVQDEIAALEKEIAMQKRFYEEALKEKQKDLDNQIEEVKLLQEFITKFNSMNDVGNKENIPNSIKKEHQSSIITDVDIERIRNVTSKELSVEEVRLICLIGSFLNVHPFGASVEYIWSYLTNIEPSVSCEHVNNLLHRFPSVFKVESNSVGSTKLWTFLELKHKSKKY